MHFLKPDKKTWLVLFVLLLALAGAAYTYEPALIFAYVGGMELPYRLYREWLHLPVGTRSDWFGFPNPNTLGFILVGLTDIFLLYVLARLIASFWNRLRRKDIS